jgi:hypothetical protein
MREQDRMARRYLRLARARNILLGAIVGVAWLADKERLPVKTCLLIPPILLFVTTVLLRNRTRMVWRRAGLAVAFYNQRLARLEDRWAGQGSSGSRYLDASHPCAADLDLFGSSCLFELLCPPCSRIGEDTLASWLCTPAAAEVVRHRQAAVCELAGHLALREDLAVLSADLPDGDVLVTLAAWTVAAPRGIASQYRWAVRFLACLPLGALVGGILLGAGLIPFLGALLLARAVGWVLRGGAKDSVELIEMQGYGIVPLAALMGRLESETFTAPALAAISSTLTRSPGPASRQLLRLGRMLGRSPLASLLLGREWVVLAAEVWRLRAGGILARWLRALGEAEALCAFAAFSFENPTHNFPEIVHEGTCFEAAGLGHPLLPHAICVTNDVRLDNELRLLVVSGSNMSGKSTLLRAVGINAVLALCGAPVRAQRMRLSPFVIGATLHVQDSLQAGHSRFFAEVLRVRRLLDLARGQPPLLFLLDELFQGTNSHDRRHGAEAVLRNLLAAGAVGLVTTHDLALTELVGLFAPHAQNVHFTDHFEDGKMVFDYRMKPGVVPSSNGLALMRAVGIEV